MAIIDAVIDTIMDGLIFLRNYAFYPGEDGSFSLMRIASLFIAFAISGAIVTFLSQAKVLKFFGREAKKTAAYLIASVSGFLLAVCSCSVLPMFASIRKKGAGLGPAVAFLFSGPAINILAMTLTFSDLGARIGFVRIVSAIILALVIGLIMALIFRKSEAVEQSGEFKVAEEPRPEMKSWQQGLFFLTLLSMLIFSVYEPMPTLILLVLLVVEVVFFFELKDIKRWLMETGDLAKKILPLFVVGVFFAGVLESVLSEDFLATLVGENTLSAGLLASGFGAVMYFATMTEVPIIQSLMNLGMHPGPAVALLLAGPTLSLPNMIVIGKVMGLKRLLMYIALVMVFAASVGFVAGIWIL